jgi:hypothetical protein
MLAILYLGLRGGMQSNSNQRESFETTHSIYLDLEITALILSRLSCILHALFHRAIHARGAFCPRIGRPRANSTTKERRGGSRKIEACSRRCRGHQKKVQFETVSWRIRGHRQDHLCVLRHTFQAPVQGDSPPTEPSPFRASTVKSPAGSMRRARARRRSRIPAAPARLFLQT